MPDERTDRRHHPDRFTLGVAMMFIAGIALGFWLILPEYRKSQQPDYSGELGANGPIIVAIFALGGLSLVGPPLLLKAARSRPWGAGRLLWFAEGTAAWLLWPPAIYARSRGMGDSPVGVVCFFYGTPLMAVYVTLSLLAGGYLRRARRRRLYRSWQETFGLLLSLCWACTGLYLISVFYRRDLFGK